MDENRKTPGQILRELRGIRTRSGVARQLGISYAALQFYETDQRNPSGRVKKLLADYYGVRVEDIFLPINTAKCSRNQ